MTSVAMNWVHAVKMPVKIESHEENVFVTLILQKILNAYFFMSLFEHGENVLMMYAWKFWWLWSPFPKNL